MTPDQEAEIRRRQKSRNIALGVTLAFFAFLFYAITIAKMF